MPLLAQDRASRTRLLALGRRTKGHYATKLGADFGGFLGLRKGSPRCFAAACTRMNATVSLPFPEKAAHLFLFRLSDADEAAFIRLLFARVDDPRHLTGRKDKS